MKWVLYSLLPIIVASIWFFGLRCLLMLFLVNATAFLVEYLFMRNDGKPVTSAVFVTGSLLALSLPPTLPFWMGMVGAVVGVTFGKMVFGGFGKNVFNPALVGRAFIYVSFPAYLTGNWFKPISAPNTGFFSFSPDLDALTTATPLTSQISEGLHLTLDKLFLGSTAGSFGETCAFLIIAGAIFISWKKAANYRLILGGLFGFFTLQIILWQAGFERAIHPLYALFSGGFIFGLCYFITEPISAPMTDEGKWFYSIFVGAMTVVIRVFSAWPEGVMFAVLLGNMYAPITDMAVKEYKAYRKRCVSQ